MNNDRFDGVVKQLLDGDIFLEQAIELLEKGMIQGALGDEATEAQVQEALEFFLEYYREHYLDYTVLYSGVRESLDRLGKAGKRMAVLTNKPVRISKAILDGLGVSGSFFQIYGGNSFDFKKPHPIGVETLIRE